ncbi:MAG: flagellar motor switch protein FliN [Gammaproteobacteria bacterium]|nr:flagellar motor switch protein FliN [Gammaproteobacteria bacterium]
MSDTEDNDADVMDEWAAAMEESGDTDTGDTEETATTEASSTDVLGDTPLNAQPASLNPLEDTSTGGGQDVNLDVLLDVPVTISMEIGQTKMNIRNLLQLNQGSVVELDRLAGEPLDVMVNGTLIAHGEVVMVNEKFGIRLTDIISPAERVKRLK